jgi:hypothetical protein
MKRKLKDRLWLWGQSAGSHHGSAGNQVWKLPGVNRMEAAEGAAYLGIERMCRVVMGGQPQPPFDAEQERLAGMKEVIWSAVGDSGSIRNNATSDLGEVLRLAQTNPNISGAVLDDFFRAKATPESSHGRYSLESVQSMSDQLRAFPGRPLDLWIVWYKEELDFDIADYLKIFDVITFWNMLAPAQQAEWEADIAKVVTRTPGKRRLAGCYLWNYGEGKPLSIDEIRAQCETYLEWIRRGEIEGIIFCSNCCTDLGLEAVEWVRQWICEHGDELV